MSTSQDTATNPFKIVVRLCPECGKEAEFLAFWDESVTCGACGRRHYEAKLAALNEGRPYTIETIGGACPTQASGRTVDDRPYYFRARHGSWTLEVGLPGWPTNLLDWPNDGECIANGDDPTDGYMDDEGVATILDRHLPA